jgi:hypothetical protein
MDQELIEDGVVDVSKLEEGEVYYIRFSSSYWIARHLEKYKFLYGISVGNGKNLFDPHKPAFSMSFREKDHTKEIRLATAEEIDWLEQCKRAGRFVDRFDYGKAFDNYNLI